MRQLINRLQIDLSQPDPLAAIAETVKTYKIALAAMDRRAKVLGRSRKPSRHEQIICDAALARWEELGGVAYREDQESADIIRRAAEMLKDDQAQNQ